MMPSITAIPNKAINPIAADTLNGVPVTKSAKTPPIMAMGITATPRRVSVVDVQKHADKEDSHRHDNPQALDCILEVAKLASPLQAVACRQLDLFSDLPLRLEHGASEIPPANAKLDRDISLLLFPVNKRCTGHQVDACDLTQGNLCDFIRDWVLYRDGQIPDRFYVLAIFRRQPNEQGKVPITSLLIEIARRLAADCGLNCRIDVPGCHPVTCRRLPIDINTNRWLAQRGEDSKIGHAVDSAHRNFYLLGCLS